MDEPLEVIDEPLEVINEPLAVPVPMARPVYPAPADDLSFEDQPKIVVGDPRRRRSAHRGSGSILPLIVISLLVLGLGGAGGFGLWYFLTQHGGGGGDTTNFETKGNFQVRVPAGWKQDAALERSLRANLALSRKNPVSGAALVYRDYKTRAATDAELLDEALKRLRNHFQSESLEYEEPFQTPVQERPTLGGQPTAVLEFVGVRDEVSYSGQVYMLTHRGYAYWLFNWGPADEREALDPKWEALRDGFSLGNQRDGWQPRPRDKQTFVSDKARYQFDHAKGLWTRADNPTDYDPEAEVVLEGYETVVDEETGRKTTVRHAGKLATVQVLVLPKQADLKAANEAAKAHLIKRQEANNFPKAALKAIENPKTGKPLLDSDTNVGALPGHLSKLRLLKSPDEESSSYVVLGVVRQGESVIAFVCECDWPRRDFWDQEFKEVLESVRPSGAKED